MAVRYYCIGQAGKSEGKKLTEDHKLIGTKIWWGSCLCY